MAKSFILLILVIFISCTILRDKEIKVDPDNFTSGFWIKYSNNPVLKPGRKYGTTITNDYYNFSDCFVIKDGTVYKMWCTSSGSTSVSAVNHCNISYAESSDGINWVKYSGNPVLDITPASWDKYAVETVSVLLDPDDTPDKRYKMWYAGRTSNTAGSPAYDFGYAYSSDGKSWTKYGSPVLLKGSSAEWDNYFIEGPSVIKDGGIYKMWYAGMDAVANSQATDGKVCIGYATSSDGVTWTKYAGNPVILTGSAGSWDYYTVQDPHVIKFDGIYYMWYGGKTNDYTNYGQQTGFAESTDGISWVKSSNNPVFTRGTSGQWDAVTASFGSVLIDNNKVKIWYTGMDKDYLPDIPDYWEIGYAEREIINGKIKE